MKNFLKNLVRYLCLKFLSYCIKGNGVLERKRNKKQWVREEGKLLGGKYERPVYFPDGIKPEHLGTQESQSITQKDFWTCVSNSLCRIVQVILTVLANQDSEIKKGLEELGFYDENGNINISQRALAVMSGTVPGRGNSMYKVVETARSMGLVAEKHCPTLPGMTEWEYFKLPTNCYELGKKFKELVQIFHEDLNEVTNDLFTYGPIQGAVATPYSFSSEGVVMPPVVYNYNHAIAWYGLSLFKQVCDSYPEFLKKFSLNYKLRSPKAIYVQKKNEVLNFPLIQNNGGIYFLAKAGKYKGLYCGFENGDVYKTFFGEYRDVKRVNVMKLPSNMARNEDGFILKTAFVHDYNPNGQNENN